MPLALTVQGVDLTLEKLLWRAYGRRGNEDDMLTRALELNPGLAAIGAVLPLGTPVVLPDLPPLNSPAARRVVNLFED